MIKYITLNYPNFKDFDKMASFYHLKSDFTKIAYEMADPIKEFVDTLEPSKDSNWYWVNAMGAGETYGANNRGDYFSRKELVDNHNTFVTNPARVYIQHRNKDPEVSIGKVAFSYFNPDTDRVELVEEINWPAVFKYAPDWLRYSLQRDDTINTSMGCLTSISKINTLEGLKEIKNIHKGDLVKTHTGAWKRVTELFSKYFDEGIYTIKVQSFGKEFKVTHEHPFYVLPREEVIEYGHLQHKKIKNKVLEPKWVKTQDLKVGDYACYVFNTDVENDLEATPEFARLLGWYLADGYVHFCKGNPNNIEIVLGKGEEHYIKEIEGLVGINKLTVKTFDTFYRLWIYDVKLAEKLLEYGGKQSKNKKLIQKALKWKPEIQLELLGAFINGDGFLYDNCSHFEIANYELAMQLCEIAARNNITWTIQEIKHIANENSVCRTGLESICWQVSFCKKYNEKLASVTDKTGIWENKNYPDRKFIYKNYIFSPITKIEFDKNWGGMIYNFEVEGDESYVADNVVVHNCKVAYDVCSICGNQAKTTALYCDHAKYAMNQFVDGKHVHVDNIRPSFFDNSCVQRGADRTARIMAKVASSIDDPETITKDEDLKIFNIPFEETESKIAEEVKEVFKNAPTFTKEYMDDLCRFELEDILGTTKIAGMELKPEEYQYIVLVKSQQEKLANDFFKERKVFKISTDKPKKIDMNFNIDLFTKMASVVPERSLYKPLVLHRSLIKKAETNTVEFKPFTSELSNLLSTGYVSYYTADMEKEAGLIENVLLAMFATLPQILKQREFHQINALTTKKELLAMRNQRAQSSKIPLIGNINKVNPIPVFMSSAPVYNVGGRGVYNPIYRNPFIQQEKEAGLGSTIKGFGRSVAQTGRSIGRGAKFTWKHKNPAIALTAGLGTTAHLAGKDKERELKGDPKAGKGFAGFARKHPYLTAGGTTLGTYFAGKGVGRLFKKKSSDLDVSEYKKYLSTLNNSDLLNIVNTIPDNVFMNLLK